MADAEVEATFREDLDPPHSPSVLRLTSEPAAVHRRDTLERLQRLDASEAVPHVVNFQGRPPSARRYRMPRHVTVLIRIHPVQLASVSGLAPLIGVFSPFAFDYGVERE